MTSTSGTAQDSRGTLGRHALILTATVEPSTSFKLVVLDPEARLAQYRESFTRWRWLADRTGLELLVVENSGVGAAELETVVRGSGGEHHRFVVDTDAAAVETEGRGVGEARLLDAAARVLASQAWGAGDTVTKVTGRLFVPNLMSVLGPEPVGIQAGLRSDLAWCDSRCFTLPFSAFETHLASMDEEIDEPREVYLEVVLARRLLAAVAAGVPWQGWRRLPRFEGVSGSSGERYEALANRSRRLVHDLARRGARIHPLTL